MDHCAHSRQIGGNTALRILSIYGLAIGTEMVKGIFLGFAVATSTLIGRAATLKLIVDNLAEPIRAQRPYLAVDNTVPHEMTINYFPEINMRWD